MKKIVCAAIKVYLKDQEPFVITAVRHADAYDFLATIMHISAKNCEKIEEGFVDSENEFLDRYDAKSRAFLTSQITVECNESNQLYSEDIY